MKAWGQMSSTMKVAASLAAMALISGAALVAVTGGWSSPYMNYMFWGGIVVVAVAWLLHFLMSPSRELTKDELYDRAKHGPGKTNFHMGGWADD